MRISRECHKCELNGTGDERCIKCPGFAEVSYKGQSIVHLGGMEAPEEFLAANALSREERGESANGGGITKELSEETERALVVILATFMQMSKTDLLIFHGLYHGNDMTKIGKEMGVSKEAIRKRVVNMAKANPKIMKAFGAMKRKGIGGAKKMTRSMIQGDLFDC